MVASTDEAGVRKSEEAAAPLITIRMAGKCVLNSLQILCKYLKEIEVVYACPKQMCPPGSEKSD